MSVCAYIAGWFPLMDGVVPAGERGRFFGKMRSSWQTVSMLFIAAAGWVVGKRASCEMLQIIIAVAALGMLGRMVHVNRIPEVPSGKKLPLRETFRHVISNGPLLGFSVYLFCLYTAANATVPVAFLFAKNYLHLADNHIVLVSSLVLVGAIVGYTVAGLFIDRYGVKYLFLTAHLGFGMLNFLLLTIHEKSLYTEIILTGVILTYGFLVACASVAVSSETLALASEHAREISLAFCFGMYYTGMGFSRFLASLILGSGMLAPEWSCCGVTFSKYHTLFLGYGCAVITACILLVLLPALVKDVRRHPNV